MELANNNFGNQETTSNAGGCGFPPVGSPTKVITGTKRVCKYGICVNVPDIRTVPNEEYKEKLKKYKECVEEKVGDIKDKVGDIKDKVGDKIKKARKKLKELVGKAKNGMQKRIRKAILKKVGGAIRINAHGMAARLYPAIISMDEAVRLKYRKAFISKSKSSYNEILEKWIELGGTQSSLDELIKIGARKRMKRFKKSPYKYLAKKSSFNGGWENWTGEYSNVEGEEDEIPEDEVPSTETVTAEELAALEAQGADDSVDSEEKAKGFKAFIQRILSIFKKNKAEETPYEEGTPEADAYNQDKVADVATLPTGSIDDGAIPAIPGGGSDDDSGSGDNKIMGIPKKPFYIGVGILVLVGGFLAYKKFAK